MDFCGYSSEIPYTCDFNKVFTIPAGTAKKIYFRDAAAVSSKAKIMQIRARNASGAVLTADRFLHYKLSGLVTTSDATTDNAVMLSRDALMTIKYGTREIRFLNDDPAVDYIIDLVAGSDEDISGTVMP